MTQVPSSRPAGRGLRVGLWTAQVLLAAGFIPAGLIKLSSPVAKLAAQLPWTGQVPEPFLRFTGLVDLCGGLGVLLPALTRIAPRLTPFAALGCSVLQVCAIAFHSYRGEFFALPLNFVLLSLSVFVFWGRTRKAPIQSRALMNRDGAGSPAR